MSNEFDAFLGDEPVIASLTKSSETDSKQPFEIVCRKPNNEIQILKFGDVEAMDLLNALKSLLGI